MDVCGIESGLVVECIVCIGGNRESGLFSVAHDFCIESGQFRDFQNGFRFS